MSKKKIPPAVEADKIHLFSINVFKSNLETSEAFLDAPKKVEGFDFGLARNFAHNLKEKGTRIRLYFTMEAVDEEKQILGLKAEYGIEFHFHIDNFEDFVKINKKKELDMDAAYAGTLLGIAYSTSRGIILERIQGTFFDAIILPVLDPIKVAVEGEEKS